MFHERRDVEHRPGGLFCLEELGNHAVHDGTGRELCYKFHDRGAREATQQEDRAAQAWSSTFEAGVSNVEFPGGKGFAVDPKVSGKARKLDAVGGCGSAWEQEQFV